MRREALLYKIEVLTQTDIFSPPEVGKVNSTLKKTPGLDRISQAGQKDQGRLVHLIPYRA